MSINSLLNNPTILSGIVGDIYQYVIPPGVAISNTTTFDGVTIANNKLGNVYKVDINITLAYEIGDDSPGPMQCLLLAWNGYPVFDNFIENSIAQCDIQSGSFINVTSSFVFVSDSNNPLQFAFQAKSNLNLPNVSTYSGTMVVQYLPNITFHQ
jgi:hypothetical protein